MVGNKHLSHWNKVAKGSNQLLTLKGISNIYVEYIMVSGKCYHCSYMQFKSKSDQVTIP
jgi:hypothetical protein